MVSWNASAKYGIQVIQITSPVVVSNSIRLLRKIVVGAVLFSLVLIPILSYGLIRNFWHPVKKLSKAIKKVNDGDFSVQVEVTHMDEIGQLTVAFNSMLRRTEQLIANIESKQRLLRIAQVASLQAQIKPHFIYNTLDLIKWYAKDGETDNVVTLAIQLGKLIRMTISGHNEFISIKDELDTLNYYLSIQQYRFSDRMNYKIDVDDSILECKIPRLIIQPLVENAIIHGLEEKRGGGNLTIKAMRDGEYLRFIVQDNGKGISEKRAIWILDKSNSQIGIRNVHLRAKLYGDSYCGLYIDSKIGEGTKIVLLLKEIFEEEDSNEKSNGD